MTNARLFQLMLQVCMELDERATVDFVPKGTLAKAQKVRREVRRRECGLLAAELERGLRDTQEAGRG